MSEKIEDILLIERLLSKRTTSAISPLSIALLIFILFIIWFQTIIPWIINPSLNYSLNPGLNPGQNYSLNSGQNYSNFGQNQGLNRDYFRQNRGLNYDSLGYDSHSLNYGLNHPGDYLL
jgi:hypothetical protein